MNSAERAARLKLVADDDAERIRREEQELAAKRRHGNWRWQVIGSELHFRNRTLPTLRIDVLRPEARDLMAALAVALKEKLPKAPRQTKSERTKANKARRSWNKAHEIERSYALKQLAEEFAEQGGW